MGFFSWRQWLNRKPRSNRRSSTSPFRTLSRRLDVETLEERLTPATDAWTGGPLANTNFNWSNAANWSNGVPNPGDDLVFLPLATASPALINNNDLATGTVFNSITFSGSGYTIGGNTVDLGNTSPTGSLIANVNATNDVINLNIVLASAPGTRQFITVNTAGTVLSIDGTLTTTNNVSMTKNGPGTLVLGGNDSGFLGAITVQQGALQITNALGLGTGGSSTTVQSGAQLQVNGAGGNVVNIPEPLLLNGPGLANDGAILNVAGNNSLAAPITLGSDTTFGATAGALVLNGQISDGGAGHSLIKEGQGEVDLDPLGVANGNTYRGQTIVNNGILGVRHSLAMGPGGSVNNETIVNSFPNESGTLQLQYVPNVARIEPNHHFAADGVTVDGFTVPNQLLVINGPGKEGVHVSPRTGAAAPLTTVTGALSNSAGNNAWEQNVTLWSGGTAVQGDPAAWPEPVVAIGAETGTNLTIDGQIGENTGGKAYSLVKTRHGRVIFTDSNLYTGFTEVVDGYLNLRDSGALGPAAGVNGAEVLSGATLELEADAKPDSFNSIAANRKPNFDPANLLAGQTATDVTIQNVPLTILGLGADGNGALRNISGINYWTGTVSLTSAIVRSPQVFTATTSAIGVEPDPDTFNAGGKTYNDFSQLTVTGTVQNGIQADSLTKVGLGELVFTAANTYTGGSFINQGWLTARNNNALGATFAARTYNDIPTQPMHVVAAGAALVLKTDTTGNPINVDSNLTLSGTGLSLANTRREPWLLQKGALATLDGLNTEAGNIILSCPTANPVVGIGAEQDGNLVEPPTGGPVSEMTLTGDISESVSGPGSIAKLGSQRVIVQGAGTYTGSVDVRAGVLRIQNNTALGTGAGGSTVENGASLEIQASVPVETGGLKTGVQVIGNHLTLNGQGNTTAFNYNSPGAHIAALTNVSDDNMWRGPITLASNSSIDSDGGSRLTLYANIDDAVNNGPLGSALTIAADTGSDGKLVLAGNNSYRGTTFIDLGTVNLQSGSALGNPSVPEVQTVTVTGTTGNLILSFNGQSTPASGPGALSFNAAPAQVQAALNALSTIGGSGGIVNVSQNGSIYTITFQGNLTGFGQPLLVVQPGSTAAAVVETTQGHGGVLVAGGSALDLQGDITLAGKGIQIKGLGSPTAHDLTPIASWFAMGPAPINNGQTVGNQPVTGRISGVSVDQFDPNVIYITAASGGTWKTTNGGQTWKALTDQTGTVTTTGATTGPVIAASNNGGLGYTGIHFDQTQGFVPPDDTGAAGPTNFVETVNQTISIFTTKSSGATQLSDTFDHFFGTVGALPPASSGSIFSDPIVTYDDNLPGLTAATGRFIVGDQNVDFSGNSKNVFDIAVSKSASPLTLTSADWNFYQVNTGENGFDSDYPGNFGYNKDAFVFTLNEFLGNTIDHVQVDSVSAADLVAGVSQANLHTFINDVNDSSLRPTTMHDAKAGDPMWLVSQAGDGQHINVLKMGNVLSNAATITKTQLTVNGYTDTVNVPPLQPDGSTVVFKTDSRILKAAEANNTLVATHAVSLSGVEDAARWYKIDVSTGTPTLSDQGDVTLGSNTYASYPSIDIVPSGPTKGTIGMTFMDSGTGANAYLSMYITGRTPTDPAGTMETSIQVPAGAGLTNYSDFAFRAGDMSGINIDPLDNSFWAVNEFANTDTTGANWGTAIANFTLGTVASKTVLPLQSLFTGALAVAPEDPTTIYMAGGEGNNSYDSFYGRGVYKSTDSGQTWTLLPQAGLDRGTITKIVVDPLNKNVIYVAENGAGGGINSLGGNGGIWKFNGASWTNMTLGKKVADDTAVVFAGTEDYTDLAVSVETRTGANHRFISFAVGTPDGGFSTFNFFNAAYISIDDGTTWNIAAFPRTEAVNDDGISTLVPRNGVIKLGMSTPFNNTVFNLYASVTYPTTWWDPFPIPGVEPSSVQPQADTFRDTWRETITWNGSQWVIGGWGNTAAQPPNTNLQGFPGGPDEAGDASTIKQGSTDTVLAVDPTNPQIVYIAGIGQPVTSGPWMSRDGGASWTDIGPGVGTNGPGPHTDYQAMSFDNQARLLVGTDGGLWRLDSNVPGSIKWTDLNGNLDITQLNGVAQDPANPFLAYGGSEDNGAATFNGALAWTHTDNGDGGAEVIDNNHPNIIYHVQDGALRKSTDSGATWNTPAGLATSGNNQYFPLIIDTVNTSRILFGFGAAPIESSQQGIDNSFVNLDPTHQIGNRIITALAYARLQGPFDNTGFPTVGDTGSSSYVPNTIYVATTNGVFVTKNHGNTWLNRSTGLPAGAIQDITVDPNNSDVAYVVYSKFNGLSQVWQTTNAGLTWSNITSNLPDLPAYKVLVDAKTEDVFVGNDNGVWRLPSGSTTWQRFGVGMPNVQVRVLSLNPNNDRLTAGTYGRGMFELWLDDSRANGGAIRAAAGQSVLTGPVALTGDLIVRSELNSQVTIVGNIANFNPFGVTVTFQGAYANAPQIAMTADGTLLTGVNVSVNVATTTVGSATTDAVQTITFGGAITGGTFALTFNNGATSSTTAPIPYSSNLATLTANIQSALDALLGAGNTAELAVAPSNHFGLVKSGPGTLVLAGTNSYGGGTLANDTFVKEGVLVVQNRFALGASTSGTVVSKNAALQMQSDISGEPLTLNGNGIAVNGHNTGALRSTTNTNVYSGPITLATDSTIGVDSGSQLTVTGTIQDGAAPAIPPGGGPDDAPSGPQAFQLTKELTGTLILDPFAVTVTFQGSYANAPQVTMAPDGTLLTGVNATVNVATTTIGSASVTAPGDAVQTITFGGTVTGGTFTLSFNNGTTTLTTTPIAYSSDLPTMAANIQTALDALLGTGNTKELAVGNSYQGGTIVEQGALNIRKPLALGTIGAASAVLANPGTGYTVGQVLTVVGGTFSKPAQITVTSVGGLGDITGFNVSQSGDYSVFPTNNVSVNVGSATFTLTGTPSNTTVEDGAQLQMQGGITVVNQPLTLSGTGIFGTGALLNAAGNNTWQGPITLSSITVNLPPKTIPVAGIAIGVAGAGDTLFVNGPINESAPVNGITDFGIQKVGPGTVVLQHKDTYTGLTEVSTGILTIQDKQALGTAGGPPANGTLVDAGASLLLDLDPTATGIGQTVSGETLTLNGAGVNGMGALDNISGPNTWAGAPIILSSNSSIGVDGGTLTIRGGISDPSPLPVSPATLTKVGVGTVFLPNANTYAGLTQVQNGILSVSAQGALGAPATSEVQAITSTGLGGKFSLSFNGSTTGLLDYNATQPTVLAALNALPSIGGGSVGGSVSVNLTGTSDVQTVTVTGTSGTFRLTFRNQQTGLIAFNAPATGPGSVQEALASLPAIGSAANVNVALAGTVYTITFAGALQFFNQPQITATATGGDSVVTTTMTPGTGVYNVTFNGALAGFPQPMIAVVPGNTAPVSVARTTAGTGGTAVGVGGTLQLEAGATKPYSNETLQLSGAGFNGMGALNSASGSNIWDSPILLVGNASIGADALNNPATLTVDQTISELSPSSNLTKVGMGNVAFSGTTSNIYTGVTTVSDGMLQLNKAGGAIAVAGNVVLGDTPDVDGASDLDTLQLQQSSQINPASTVSIVSDGNFDLNGQTQSIAALNMTGGFVSLNGNASVLTLNGPVVAAADSAGNPATVNGPGTLALTAQTGNFTVNGPGVGSEDMQINAVITGGVGLTKSGPGTLQLTNQEQYTGTTTIAQGTLLADDLSPGVNTVGAVSLSGGTLAGVGQVGSITSAPAGGIVSPGDTPTSPATLTSGPVVWNNATTFNLVINSLTAFSVLNVKGTIDLGNANMNANLGVGFAPSIGDSFVIITATGTISNAFATNQPGFVFIAGMKFSIVVDNSGATKTVTVTRVKANTVTSIVADHNPAVYGQIVTFTATVAPEVGGTGVPSGTVTFKIDGVTVASNVSLLAGQATFVTSSLPTPLTVSGSPHTVNVFFTDGDGLFNGSDSTASPVLEKIVKAPTATTVTADANPSVFGQLVTFTATVSAMPASPAAPTGTVNFLIDSIVVAQNVVLNSAGVATYKTPAPLALTNGTPHTVFVVYTNADGNFVSGSGNLAGGQVVNKADTTITVASTNANAVYGEPIITAIVAAKAPGAGTPTGTVTFTINNGTTSVQETDALKTVTVGGNQVQEATLLQVPIPGTYTITASYVGDIDFNGNAVSNSLSQTVSQDTVNVAVASSQNPAVYGQPVTISATITPVAPGGTAAGAKLPSGTADLVIDSGPALAPAIATATVTNGVVSFTPTAAIAAALSFINGSTHQIKVVYHGDGNYIANNSILAGGQQINKANTTAVMAASVNPSVFGQPVVFSATITPQFALGGAPGGTANLYIDDPTTTTPTFANVSVVNGAVSFPAVANLSLTSGAPHLIKVVYNGDGASGNFNGGSNAILTPGQTVKQASSTTTIAADVGSSVFGQVVTFTATVQGKAPSTGVVPTGSVVFFIDGNQADATPIALDINGKATFKTSSLPAPLPVTTGAPHTVTVSYVSDNGNFLASSATLAGGETVSKASTTTTVSSSAPGSAVYGAAAITATVAPVSPGAGAPSGNVTFTVTIGASTITESDPLKTVSGNQVATLQRALTPGSYTITAAYNGDTSFTGGNGTLAGGQVVTKANTSELVSSSQDPSVFGQPVTFSATISAVAPGGTVAGSAVPGGTADLVIDGTTVFTGTTVTNGSVTFLPTTAGLTASAAAHSVQVVYHGDTNYAGITSALSGGQTVNQAGTSVLVASSANPSVFGQGVTFSATVSAVAPGAGSPGGTANLVIDGSTIYSNVAVTGGLVSFAPAVSSLSVGGPHVVQVIYNGDNANFSGSNALLAGGQTVNQSPTTTTVVSSSNGATSTFGQPVTFTATVAASGSGAGTPTGTVNFYDGLTDIAHKLGTGTLNQLSTDQASFTTTSLQLTGGAHAIIAVYQADTSFATSQGTVTQTVLKVGTSTTDVSSNNVAAVYGQPITLTSTVTSQTSGVGTPTGTINFYDGVVNGADLIGSGTVNGGGTASITLPSTSPALAALGVGSHTLTAVYQADVNFMTSTSPAPQTVQQVTKASTSTTLFSDTLPSAVYGQETITATVADTSAGSTGTPTGNVVFTIVSGSNTVMQSVPLVGGVATLTSPTAVLSTLSAAGSSATYTISATYQGDGNFTSSPTTGSVTQTVTQASSSTQLSASPATSSVAGQQVTFTAVVKPTAPGAGLPSGTVTFFDGNTQIGSQSLALVSGQEQASIQISSLAVSSTAHSISAKYAGDTNFINSTSSTLAFTVGMASTTTTLTSAPSTSTYGQPVTFTGTVTVANPGNGTATGTVAFYDGSIAPGSLLGTGTLNQNAGSDQATFTTTAVQLPAGSHTIIAVYSGDATFTRSQSQSSNPNLTVQQDTTTTVLVSTKTNPIVGRPFTVTATVTSVPPGLALTGGTVTFTVDSTTSAPMALSGGQATITVTFSTPGNHTINALYSGDSNFIGSSASTLAIGVLTPNQGYVAQAYRDLLHREVDAGGLAYWSGLLDQGRITRPQFALGLDTSTEYHTDAVQALFVHYLHRSADSGAISFFVSAMGNGMSEEQIAAILAGSDEYYSVRGGGTVDGFLNALYADALNRGVDPGARQAFTQALSFHVSRQQIATTVLGSYEYKSDLVTGFYGEFLHRGTDAGGLNFWATRMTQGLSDEQFIALLVGSDEYYNNSI